MLKKEKRTPKFGGGGILSRLSAFLLTAALLAAVFPFAPLTADAADSFTEGYFTYSIYEDETGNKVAYITDCNHAIPEDVVIPSTLGGYPVTAISQWVFFDFIGLKSVTIPASVTGTFNDDFENYYREIYPVFGGCTSLTAINVDGNNTKYKSVDGVLYSKDMKTLLAYPAGKTNASYTIPDGVTLINSYAFYDCTSLKEVTIPNSVTEIEVDAFSGCTSLTAINVDENNTKYKSVDGVLYSKDMKTLLAYPAGKTNTSYTIPDSVSEIRGDVFEYCTSLTKVTIPDSVTKIDRRAFSGCTSLKEVTIPNSVTEIGDSAFLGCKSLTKVTIPDSVTKIGYGAFSGCTSLKEIAIPNSVTEIGNYAFLGCTSLTKVTIPNSVTEIGYSAFEGCTSLTSVTLPDSAEIGTSAFSGCTSLKEITLPAGVSSIYYYCYIFSDCISLTAINVDENNTDCKSVDGVLFSKDMKTLWIYPAGKTNTSYTIPDSVTKIDRYAFSGCTSLKEVTIPDSVTVISDTAFRGCTSLTAINVYEYNMDYISVDGVLFHLWKGQCLAYPAGKTNTSYTIPDSVTWTDDFDSFTGSVTEISDYAFSGCTSLKEVTIPDGVTEIGDTAFEGCTSLKEITIPASVTEISNNAFDDCTSLTAINVDENNTKYKSVDGVLFNKDMTTLILYPNAKINASYAIPNSVTEIEVDAFSGCTSLTKVTVPDSVTVISDTAFQGCTSLKEITIPNSVTEISNYAFSGCTSLTKVTIPDSVTKIGYGAFSGCTSLKEVTIPNNVTIISSYNREDAFENCTNLTKLTIYGYETSIYAFRSCTSLTIYCYRNSLAHVEALNDGVPFVLLDETDPEPQPDPDLDIDEKAGMIRSEAGMTAEALLAGLAGGSYTVTDANGAALSSGALVGTGAVVTGTAAGETVRYTVVVRGDVNGDGRQTATDYLRTKRAVLKIEALEGVYYEAAACFDGRDGLTAADYLSMKRAILGLA